MWAKLLDTVFHRSLSFLVAAVFLLCLALVGSPQLFEVTIYKLGLVCASASAGYWIDRVTFPYARPDRLQDEHVDFDQETPVVTDDGYEGLMVGATLYNPTFAHAMIRRDLLRLAHSRRHPAPFAIVTPEQAIEKLSNTKKDAA